MPERLVPTVVLVLVSLALAGSARADADPASDSLYTVRIF
jgi:isochorismate synthase EntC